MADGCKIARSRPDFVPFPRRPSPFARAAPLALATDHTGRCPSGTLQPTRQNRRQRPPITERLAFDVGDDIVGIIDLRSNAYASYRGPDMPDGARRILDCDGVVINFNGILYDLPELANIFGIADPDALPLKGTHCDMRVHACRDRCGRRVTGRKTRSSVPTCGITTVIISAGRRPTLPAISITTTNGTTGGTATWPASCGEGSSVAARTRRERLLYRAPPQLQRPYPPKTDMPGR